MTKIEQARHYVLNALYAKTLEKYERDKALIALDFLVYANQRPQPELTRLCPHVQVVHICTACEAGRRSHDI